MYAADRCSVHLPNRLQLYYWLIAVGSVPMMVFQWLKLEGATSPTPRNGKLLLHHRQLESELSYRRYFAWQANHRDAAQPSRTDSWRGLLLRCQYSVLVLTSGLLCNSYPSCSFSLNGRRIISSSAKA